ncbi:MAG: formylmethanofuran dehydrogenase subunit E family protein [Candidatus Bathyarchaeia archaeon]
MPKRSEKLDSIIKRARELHGHLGPFLVIGVRIGEYAKKTLKGEMKVLVRVPMTTPLSCIIDGIQASTQCTVGNRKLSIEESENEIVVHFKSQKTGKSIKVYVKPQLVEELKQKLSQGIASEELAQKVASALEGEIFTVEKQ